MKRQQNIITITDVVLDWASIFRPAKDKQGNETKYQATFYFDKDNSAHMQTVAELKDQLNKIATEERFNMSITTHPDKFPLRDLDLFPQSQRKNSYSLKATNSKFATRVGMVTPDRKIVAITENDNAIYNGCIVHAKISFYAISGVTKEGKKFNHIGANLYSVLLVKTGEEIKHSNFANIADEFADLGYGSSEQTTPTVDLSDL